MELQKIKPRRALRFRSVSYQFFIPLRKRRQIVFGYQKTKLAGEGDKKRDGKPGRRAGVEKGGKAQREAESWLGFDALKVV